MTVVATKFTPEVLLSAPRRSAGSPNLSGKKILFTVSTYSFEDHKKTSQIKVLDVASGHSTILYDDLSYSEPVWVDEEYFLFVKSGEKGTSSLMLGSVSADCEPAEVYQARGSVSNLKVKPLSNNRVLLACSALATPDGQMYNPDKDDEKVYHTGRVYSSLYVRHWDSYVGKNKNAVWYGTLKWQPASGSGSSKSGRTLSVESSQGLINALAGTGLESPVPPFGGASDFDVSPHGLAFVARDLDVNPAIYTKSSVYFVPLDFASGSPKAAGQQQPTAIPTPGLAGYSAGPAFSPDGRSLAFTRMRDMQYESDKPRLMLARDVAADPGAGAREFFATDDGEGAWDLRPDGAPLWSDDAAELFVVAEERGRGRLFRVASDPDAVAAARSLPEPVQTEPGTVGDVQRMPDGSGRLFVSSSSLIDGSSFSIVEPSAQTSELVSSLSRQGKTFGLSRSQVDEIWFAGAGDYQVHALVVKPSHFDDSKRYPLALLIHGGPQGAWNDSWSTRWNPAIFAEQGYVVVCPNPTGSTGYGMALQNGIRGEWGGRPYNDLVKCFEHIEQHMPYVDTVRSVALGASYGGYMINWIQGHDLGRKFKALVCHDGVFSTQSQYSSEELFFPIHDFGGSLWENREGYEKWDPSKHVDQWSTAQLIIHNELDYRLTISEGLAVFNVLQHRGIASRFLTFPDENHWTLKPENSLLWHQEVIGWINKYVGMDQSELAQKTQNVRI
ncbi:hypothetical protein GGTG_01491 [Gaeumannomyces tritici R3-111a-1]|uniref:Dipeptidyl-peptidase V n=1 Tax=Gaeumannomyces tritici (strain R3-111a-1) TaxID=644352 RepID=J3NJR1_GAET3|nr:hypothetical protein GGTG_01491 [Gaeumannomyces tritici R3-111a-1]EJT81513.1 hypothetical protein GGTG_01491 [Gaeumannomyces tritici R3-111a-1]